MRKALRTIWLLIPLATILLLSPGQAQNPPSGGVIQANRVVPADTPLAQPRDGSKLPPTAQPIFFSAYRAMDWLKRTNKPDGRFVYGFLPALRTPMDGDNFLSQAGATFALARSSRYFQDKQGTAIARQAALTLLMETMEDPGDGTVRTMSVPPAALNRLASHGMLMLAIHELASPGDDLLKSADQLGNYFRKQQRSDGSLIHCEGMEAGKPPLNETEIQCAGLALHGLIRNHKERPANWKLDMVRKGRVFYLEDWRANKNLATVFYHTPALAEAYLLTKEPAFAEAVFAMNDWLLGLQYGEDHESSRKHWQGGFQRCSGGKQEMAVPDIRCAVAGESLAEACRVAKQAGDLPRLQRYERGLIQNLHFAMSLQYTSARVQHFVENYRPAILGAFYGSHQDGNLRLDYTQHPLSAMVQYLGAVIE